MHQSPRRVTRGLAAIGVLVTSVWVAAPARAAFMGPYDVSYWTLTTEGDSSIDLAGAPGSIELTGSNASDLTPGPSANIDFMLTRPSAITVSFDWSYNPTTDTGAYDIGYFLVNGVPQFTVQNDSPSLSGSVTNIAIPAGTEFGFRVFSADQAFGEGILTISNFAVVGEPGAVLLLGVGIGWIDRIRSRRSARAA